MITPEIVDRAVKDIYRKKYGLNVVFLDADGNSVHDWKHFLNEKQTDNEIELLHTPNASTYGYVCGWNGLIAVEFEKPLVYFLAKKHFEERFDTFTVRTPNNGRVLFFFTGNRYSENIDRFVDNLHVNIVMEGYAPVSGWVDSAIGITAYIPDFEKDIRRDNNIVEDLLEFLEKTLAKLNFFEYECVKYALRGEVNGLNYHRKHIFMNFLMHAGLHVSEAKHFFKFCRDYEEDEIVKRLKNVAREIKEKDIKPYRCEKLREYFRVDKGICRGCIRRSEYDDDKITDKKSRKKGELELPSTEDVLEDFVEERPKIHTGQYFDMEDQKLYYAWYNSKKNAFVVLSEDGVRVGLYDADIGDWGKVPEEIVRVEGAKIKPPKRVENLILPKVKEWSMKGLPENRDLTLSRFYDEIYQLLKKYIYFSDEREYSLVALWITGTYMRQVFIWYPYLVLYGLRNVGKSTTLSFLSKTCFQGPGEIAGDSSEAVMFRKADALKGIMFVEHYEEIRENPVKDQMYRQFLENSWYKDSTVERMNNDTMSVESFNTSACIAVGTRALSDVLDEKGIVILMEEAPNTRQYSKKFKEMILDPKFDEILVKGHIIALKYAKKVYEVYNELSMDDGFEAIQGRDWNKLSPMLALAKVIDEEKETDSHLKELYEYGVTYSKMRKQDSIELEDIVLQIIIQEHLKEFQLSDMQDHLKYELGEEFNIQKIAAIMQKLRGIVKDKKRVDGKQTYYIDLKMAKKKAVIRGLLPGDDGIFVEDDTDSVETDTKPVDRDDNDKIKGEYQEAIVTGDYEKFDDLQKEVLKEAIEDKKRRETSNEHNDDHDDDMFPEKQTIRYYDDLKRAYSRFEEDPKPPRLRNLAEVLSLIVGITVIEAENVILDLVEFGKVGMKDGRVLLVEDDTDSVETDTKPVDRDDKDEELVKDNSGNVGFSEIEETVIDVIYHEMNNSEGVCGIGTITRMVLDRLEDATEEDVWGTINDLKMRKVIEEPYLGHLRISEVKLPYLIDSGVIKEF